MAGAMVGKSDFLRRLESRLQSLEHSDVTLQFQDAERLASSWLILTALSPVFEAMFQNSCLETRERVVSLPTVDHVTFSAIMAFTFGQEDAVTHGNAMVVMEVAHLLLMEDLTKHCAKFLVRSLAPDTCLRAFRLAQLFEMKDLGDSSFRYFHQHLIEVSKTASFRELTLHQVKALLTDVAQQNVSEDMACMAFMNWLSDKPLSTTSQNTVLSTAIKHHELTEYFVCNVMQSGQHRDGDETREHKSSTPELSSPLLPSSTCVQMDNREQSLATSAAATTAGATTASVLGGIFGFKVINVSGYIVSVYEWHVAIGAWLPLDNPKYIFKDGFATAVLHGNLYVTGIGIFGGPTVTCMYDRRKSLWSRVGDVRCTRCFHGMAAIRETVYVIGGLNKNGRTLKTVEALSSFSQQWRFVGNLSFGVYACAVGVVGDTMVVVGKTAVGGMFKNLIQTFNPSTRTASFYVNRLPDSAIYGHMQAASLNDVVCLLSSEGDFVMVAPRDNNVKVTWRTRLPLQKTLRDGRFSFCMDGSRVVVASNSAGRKPMTYDIQGSRLDGCVTTGCFPTAPIARFSNTANLTSDMYVHTLYRLHGQCADME